MREHGGLEMAEYDVTVWLSKQHQWLQEAAVRLRDKKMLQDKDIADFIDIMSGKMSVAPDLSKPTSYTSLPNSVSIISIGNINGIDRLNPRKPLVFSENGLTIVYGRNGSGKSGYSRILKRACGKTTAMLQSNVYESPRAEQTVDVQIIENGIKRNETWDAKGAPLPSLSTVDIFDGLIGDFYLREDSEAAYTPPELTLFSDLASTCDKVAAELDARKQKLLSKLPKLPSEYSTTQIAFIYNGLEQAEERHIKELLIFSENDSKTLQSLDERLEITDPADEAKKLRKTKKHIEDICDRINNLYNIVESKAYINMDKLIKEAKNNRKIVEEAAEVLKSSSKLDGVGLQVWRSLWEAARTYSETVAYKGVPFPNAENNAVCVLCNQPLNDDAKQRMKQFETFVQGSLESKAESAESALDSALDSLPDTIDEKQWDTISKAAEIEDNLSEDIWKFCKQAYYIIEKYKSRSIDISDIPSLCIDELVQSLLKLVNICEQKASQFEKDAQSFDREKTKQEVLELKARKWISEQKNALYDEIERIKAVKSYDELKKKTNTRTITTEAGVASEALVTQAYIGRFNNELMKLGASKLSVELVLSRNEKGKGKYRVQLKNTKISSDKLAQILSDGEKRIVSLAAFLANSTGREEKVPFVFDDPISSLDQEFEEATARRLFDLSQTRQVIVFTHRISFLGILTEVFVDNEINTICINDEVWGTGEPSDTPINAKRPKNAFKNLLNDKLSKAIKELNENGTDVYENLAQAICSDFRKLIERTVELVLMNGIVERHRRSVQTQGKIEKLSKISIEDCAFLNKLMSKYSAYEHSQSDEFPVSIPKPDSLRKDLERIISWIDEFEKR